VPAAHVPLWTCPRCGQRFVTANLWHSCVRVRVADHLVGRPPEVVELYRAFARAVRACGPGVRVTAVKTRIAFMVRVRFAACSLQRGGLRAHVWTKRRLRSTRFDKVEHLGRSDWIHHFHLRVPGDLDDEVRGWLAEAYRVGRQESAEPGP